MQSYLVGGAVRDLMMGLEPKDRDYVVVGETPESMLAAGFKQVGADFPVFLHPDTSEEYALARIERKTGDGYHGFETDHSPHVTLEEDLRRRDLTINSMALTANDQLIDPYGGLKDLENKVLRHTSEAFREDPVRILRVARFAARYNFSVHPDTYALMREMVMAGEIDHLTPERVWKELERAFMEPYFWKLWCVLDDCGALTKIPLMKDADFCSFEAAADANEPLEVRVAAMMRLGEMKNWEWLRMPKAVTDLALTAKRIEKFLNSINAETSRKDYLGIYVHVDVFRRPERFWSALRVLKYQDVCVHELFKEWAQAVTSVDAGMIAASCTDNTQIRPAIEAARIKAME